MLLQAGVARADLVDADTGDNENNQVVEGEIWKGVHVTDAPADSGHHVHSQFGVAGSGRPLIDPFTFHGVVLRPRGQRLEVTGINHRSSSNDVVLYTARQGETTPADLAGATVDIRLRFIAVRGDTSNYQVTGFPIESGVARLADGPVLSVPVTIDTSLVPHAGETIRIQTNLRPAPLGLRTVVGGWPRLVVHGQSIADSVDRLEGTTKAFSVTRHPRTGIGFSRDSTTLYLITVDGRQESSSGMSLAEFAALMVRLGVYEGLNLDGGGSTTMVINGNVVNSPSDKEGERTVGNALLVVLSRREQR